MADEPRYEREEVALILRRAQALQSARGITSGGYRALSLHEVEGSGRELGIDPELIRKAALEVASQPRPRGLGEKMLGFPSRVSFEHSVEREISDDELNRLLEVVETTIGPPGQLAVVGRSVRWNGNQGPRQLHIYISRRDGQTRIRTEESFRTSIGSFLGTWIGGGGGGGCGVGMSLVTLLTGSIFAGVLSAIGIFIATGWIARIMVRHTVMARVAELESMHAALADALERPSPPQLEASRNRTDSEPPNE